MTQTSLLFNHCFSTLLRNRTHICLLTNKSYFNHVFIRFVGGDKPMGHALKVLNALSKTEAASFKVTPQANSLGITSNSHASATPLSVDHASSKSSEPVVHQGPKVPTKFNGISSIKDKIHPGAQPGYHSIFDSFKNQKDSTVEVGSSLPSPISPHIPSNIKPELRGEYEKEIALAKKDNKAILQALSERCLLDLEISKAKSAFYKHLLDDPNTPKEYITLSREDFEDPIITIGLLKVDENTIILSGKQMHPIVLYKSPDNRTIAWSYLTSENDTQTIELSPYQPFSNKLSKQFLRIIKPLFVKDGDIESLPPDQEAKARLYLEQPNIKNLLKDNLSQNLESTQVLEIYTRLGFVTQDLINVLTNYELDQIKNAEKLFTEYKSLKNTTSVTYLEKWLHKTQYYMPHSYKYLIKLIEKHENK